MSENILYQCRLCLAESQFCYSLFDEDVTEMIESLTSIKVVEDDGLPAICCSQCLADIYVATKIRCRIIESDKVLRQNKNEKNEETEDCSVKSEPLENSLEPGIEAKDVAPLEFVPLPIKVEHENSSSDVEEIEIAINPDLNVEFRNKIRGKKEPIYKVYECSECEEKFRLHKLYLQHMKKHVVTSVCQICGVQVLAGNLSRHMEVHRSSPKVCELCGAVAKNSESLRGHMFYMHKSTAEQYKCVQCNKFYRYKYKYKLHMRKAHGGDKSHICEVCGKDFYTARDVNRHLQMTHMKLRPYICQYCNKGFSSSYARRTHIRQHTNEKPFKCELCAEGFRQRVSLKTHLKSKHGVTPGTEENQSETLSLVS